MKTYFSILKWGRVACQSSFSHLLCLNKGVYVCVLTKLMFVIFYRHTPELWHDSFHPSLWESLRSPWYMKPWASSNYVYFEFSETGKGKTKDEGQNVKEGTTGMQEKLHEDLKDSESFKVSFNVSSFKPEEITVHSEDGELVVKGNQEVESNEGYSTRHFVRTYSLPKNVDHGSFTSRLSKEGILSIEAKKLQKHDAEGNFIKIEIEN